MIKQAVQFYLTDVISGAEDNELNIFGRTKEGKKICVVDHLNHYFYVILKNLADPKKIEEKIKKIHVKENEKISSSSYVSFEEKRFIGKNVKAIKVVLHSKKDLSDIKAAIKEINGVDKIHETDIPLSKRYLIDRGLTPLALCEVNGDIIRGDFECECIKGKVVPLSTEIIKPRVLAFDIETFSKGGMPVEERDPVLTIALKGDNFEKVISWNKFDTDRVEISFVKDEKKLIEEFVKIVKAYDPDYLIGYFSDGFDFPYLKKRADIFNIKLNLNLDKSNISIRKNLGNSKIKIKGIVHLDIFKFIRYIMGGSLRLDSFSLDSVSKELLGEGKHAVDVAKSSEIFEEGLDRDKEEFCLYNLQDANLTFKLFEKIVPNLNEIVKLVGQPVFDICRTSFGQLVEWYLMKRMKEFNEIYPNKPDVYKIRERRQHSYMGGSVLEPTPGLHENIAVVDFRAFWPSIISAYNICPSTLTENKEHANESPDINGKRYYFNYKEEGFIPKIITDLIQRRIRINEIIKNEGKNDPILNARSYSLKILTNSFYGYLGFFGARWYALECSASITAYGREYIQKVIEHAKKSGFEVLYSDTDSIMFILGDKTKADALNFLKEINRELPSLMELELENFYKRGLFVVKKDKSGGAKKKYALLDYNDKLDVRGFETVRRDWSYIARDIQKDVIKMILKDGNCKNALKYIIEMINEIKENKIPLDKMIIQTQLKRDIESYDLVGPHVAVARRMVKGGFSVGPGSIIRYVITKGDGLIRDKARLLEESENYDSEYYINHQILPAVEKIFEILGYKKEDLLNEKSQSHLGDF